VQKKIGECVEEVASKVLRQVGGPETGDEDMPQKLMAFQSEAKQLLSARTLL
jgi:hypothetical protein